MPRKKITHNKRKVTSNDLLLGQRVRQRRLEMHISQAGGEQFIELHPAVPNKDLANALVRSMFDLRDVVRYVYTGEAWTLDRIIKPDEQELIFRRGIANHPDRVEIVQLQGEDQDYGQIIGQRKIIRPAKGKPYLEPRRWSTTCLTSRMVHLWTPRAVWSACCRCEAQGNSPCSSVI
jgi:hypothetical protein